MKKITTILLLFLVIAGFIYRFVGIQKGLSFWNDESHTALMTRGILWYGKPVTGIGVGNGFYQVALYSLTAAAFAVGGINEVAGRFPSVVAGTLLIAASFWVTRKLFGSKQALIVAFLTTFSQIQLAWSTQLRPYIWLELATILVIYFSYKNNLVLAILLAMLASLFHGTGLINFGFVGLAMLISAIRQKSYRYFLAASLLGPVAIGLAYLSGPMFFRSHFLTFSFATTHYRVFLAHNYLWLLVPALIGAVFVYKENRPLFSFVPVAAIFIFVFANFKINPDYVRYSLPAFPLLYILFAQGLVKLKRLGLILGVLSVLLAVKQEKIVLVPRYYYSINADMRENPIVDYKLAFERIKTLINNRKDVIVLDAWNDRVPYYLPNQKFAMITRFGEGQQSDLVYGEKYVKDVAELEAEKVKYPAGIVIVENWESLAPEEVNSYIRANLKHQFDVTNLPYNEADKWSLSIYSWGL